MTSHANDTVPPQNDTSTRTPGRLSRRRAIQGGLAGAGLLALAGSAGTRPATAQDATPGLAAGTPNADGVIVSNVPGVPNAYLKQPTPFKTTDGVPGSGGKVSMLTMSYASPPTEHDRNSFWQELEKRLGVQWDAQLVPASSYGEKVTAVIASGDMPDLFFLLQTSTAPVVAQSLSQGAFTDLTPYLSGDALRQYPNLALIPQLTWDAAKVGGKIFGVPKPVLRSNDVAFYRTDWAQTLGMPSPKTSDDVANLLVGMSTSDPDGDGKSDTWGLAGYGGGWNLFLFLQMFGAPYGWRLNADGTLTKDIETDEYRQALDYARRLYAGGAFHPDTAGMQYDQEVTDFENGTIGLHDNGFAAFYGKGYIIDTAQQQNPKATMGPLIPMRADGSPGVTFAGQGYFGMVGIPASIGKDEGRVKELLGIMNYLCAPFGSEENNFLRYGLDEDHDVEPDGSFVRNDKGKADISDLVYPFLSEDYFFFPGQLEVAQTAQKVNEELAKIAVTNPVAGLVSQTQISQGGVLGQLGTDTIAGIITGRKDMSEFDTYVQDWRSRGGDKIRSEYEEALKAKNGG